MILAIAALIVLTIVICGWFLLSPKEVTAPLPTPSLTTPDTRECRLAVHEAGHLTAAWFSTTVVKVHLATIEATYGGRVSWDYYSGSHEKAWHQLVICLAGIAAELCVYGKYRSGESTGDLQKALVLARQLAKGGTEAPWTLEESLVKSFPFASVYVERPTAKEIAVLNTAYVKARGLLKTVNFRYFRLVSLLLSCKSVGEKQVAEILGSRGFIRALGYVKPAFVLPKRKS